MEPLVHHRLPPHTPQPQHHQPDDDERAGAVADLFQVRNLSLLLLLSQMKYFIILGVGVNSLFWVYLQIQGSSDFLVTFS